MMFQVVVAKEAVGSLGGLVRQLSLDQFENESRRMHPSNGDQAYPPKKFLNRQKSPQGLHKKARICKNLKFLSLSCIYLTFISSACRLFPTFSGLEIGKLLLTEAFSWMHMKLASFVMLLSRYLCRSPQFYN